VRGSRPGHEEDSPTVGELVAQRLAARDVDPEPAESSAAREHGAPWVVTAAFEAGSGSRAARWSYAPGTRVLQPLDDEARWLAGTDAPQDPTPGAVAVFDVDATGRGRRGGPPADDGTAGLLADLSQRGGGRRTWAPAGPVEMGAQGTLGGRGPFDGFGPQGGRPPDDRDACAAPSGAKVGRLPTIRPLDAATTDAAAPSGGVAPAGRDDVP